MYRALGQFASRQWKPVLGFWILTAIVLTLMSPPWESIVHDGEFAFLPADTASRQGEELFRSAFSRDFLGSNVIIIVRRKTGQGLTAEDRDFIEKQLKPRLIKIADEDGGMTEEGDSLATREQPAGSSSVQRPRTGKSARSVITAIRTFTDPAIGHLLDSEDKQASLVMVNLRTELFAEENRSTISRIERLIAPEDGELRREKAIRAGLDLRVSGSATVGRDMRLAEQESAKSTEFWTIFLVVAILLVIYRSPLLAFVPLVTVFIAVHIALKIISIMALRDWVHPFAGIEVYITVVMYGAGVDYCVFLMSRYKEELDSGLTMDEAMASALEKVGSALVASAGTVMAGIGMMAFALFGKFQQAGIGMSLSLVIVLAAALTFTPALMLVFGRWAFWPNMRTERISSKAGWFSPTTLVARIMEHEYVARFWERIGEMILRRPGTIWLSCVLALVPLAVVAVLFQDQLSYGLMSELPADKPSVIGSNAVKEHFAPGVTGPVTVLLSNPDWDFADVDSEKAVRDITDQLVARQSELKLADVRSLSHPLGITEAAREAEAKNQQELDEMPVARRLAERGIRRKKIVDHYVSDKGLHARHITRIDVVFEDNPFSIDSIRRFDNFAQAVRDVLPASLAKSTETSLHYIGATPSLRDLKRVTGYDQFWINVRVVVSVFLVLWVLVRHIAVAGYMIVSVFFSYLVALGMTYVVFYLLNPSGFSGLDWKVPIFLFVILIAVGEDYNIYLIARIEEETRRLGPIHGVTEALARTGGIISSCGVIMAGTFSALMAGSLLGMKQLGFALAFGVLLDTFVVRPILVPAYLVLLNSGRFGWVGRFLGAVEHPVPRDLQAAGVGQEQP